MVAAVKQQDNRARCTDAACYSGTADEKDLEKISVQGVICSSLIRSEQTVRKQGRKSVCETL